jgi:3',5'-cyclic-AMP phosphodiesterase
MIIAQISDLHIQACPQPVLNKVQTADMLAECVKAILELDSAPDVIIATGDLVDHGTEADYRLLKELLQPFQQPVFLLTGNHDNRDALRIVFSDFPYLFQHPKFIQYSITVNGLNFVALDTLVPGSDKGELCQERLRWLDKTLSQNSLPTLIMMHHPPFQTGMAAMDTLGLGNVSLFTRTVEKYPHVQRIVCGHLHRSIYASVGGVSTSICPSTGHQLALKLAPDAPYEYVSEPSGYQLHLWRGECWVTHTCTIGSYSKP